MPIKKEKRKIPIKRLIKLLGNLYVATTSLIRRAVVKVPSVVWGGFAVFGLVTFGMLVGTAWSISNIKDDNKEFHQKKEDKYLQVINAYQDLSRLQYLQGQDMEIMTDVTSWYDHPEEIFDAIQSYRQKRDELLFQYGKIYELRRQANLPKDDNLTTD